MLELLSESGLVEDVQEGSRSGISRRTPPDENVSIQELVSEQAESRWKKLLTQHGSSFHGDNPSKQAILCLVSQKQFYQMESKAHTVATDKVELLLIIYHQKIELIEDLQEQIQMDIPVYFITYRFFILITFLGSYLASVKVKWLVKNFYCLCYKFGLGLIIRSRW